MRRRRGRGLPRSQKDLNLVKKIKNQMKVLLLLRLDVPLKRRRLLERKVKV